jgi:hypothetical protein
MGGRTVGEENENVTISTHLHFELLRERHLILFYSVTSFAVLLFYTPRSLYWLVWFQLASGFIAMYLASLVKVIILYRSGGEEKGGSRHFLNLWFTGLGSRVTPPWHPLFQTSCI